jgi:hypothetical protein
MSRHYRLLVLSNCVAGQDIEFNEWYDAHMAHVLKIAGFTAGQRYRRAQTEPGQDGNYQYLAIFDIETDNISAVRNAMLSAAGTDEMPSSSAFDGTSFISLFFEELT